jgi:hypothetical protein
MADEKRDSLSGSSKAGAHHTEVPGGVHPITTDQ